MRAARFLRICGIRRYHPARIDDYSIKYLRHDSDIVVLRHGRKTVRKYLERGFDPHRVLTHIRQDIKQRKAR